MYCLCPAVGVLSYGFSVHETHTPPSPSPTKPLSPIIIQAILGGTIATTGLRLLLARELCLSGYLANSEEIISKNQSGFLSLPSTVSALLETTDGWALNIDRCYVHAVVFLDLKKAFDAVDRERERDGRQETGDRRQGTRYER